MATALAPLASVDDLSEYIGEPISGSRDQKRAEWVLRTASALVRRETGRSWLDESGRRIDADAPEDVVLVTLAAASRKYLNPEGFDQERQDDWYGSRKVEESGVYLTESELGQLADVVSALFGNPHRGLGTVSTTRGDIGNTSALHDHSILPPYYDWE